MRRRTTREGPLRAAPAPTWAAFRPRRCCNRPSISSRRRIGPTMASRSRACRSRWPKCRPAKAPWSGKTTMASSTCSRRTRSASSMAAARSCRPSRAAIGLRGKQIIVATGSSARALPGTPFDEERVLSNDGALRLAAVPKRLALIGAGVIGLEIGSVWRRLGAEVTILESLPTFLGAVDEQIAKEAKKAFDKQGLAIELGAQIGQVSVGKKGAQAVHIAYTDAKGQ